MFVKKNERLPLQYFTTAHIYVIKIKFKFVFLFKVQMWSLLLDRRYLANVDLR